MKGPRWSDYAVREMVECLRIRLEAVEMMSGERLDRECASRSELEDLVGKSQELKVKALKDWFWNNAVPENRSSEPISQAANIDEELERVVGLLTEHQTATEGGIRESLFLKKPKVFEETMKQGYKTGKLVKKKTTSGTEVVVLGGVP